MDAAGLASEGRQRNEWLPLRGGRKDGKEETTERPVCPEEEETRGKADVPEVLASTVGVVLLRLLR